MAPVPAPPPTSPPAFSTALPRALTALLLLAACASTPRFAPRAPIRDQVAGVRAEILDVALEGEHEGPQIRVAIAGGPRAWLNGATLNAASAPPCSEGTGVTRVTVDEREVYTRGPADVSGSGHELYLEFQRPPSGGWPQDRVALDLDLWAPEPVCLRLSMSGTRGADWE